MGAIPLTGTYAEGQKLTLSNRYLDWDLVMTGATIKSTGFRNRLTGRYYELSDSKELVLTFSQARRRVEIPWWNYELGSENDHSLPDQEAGYLRGYHREDFRGEEKWKKTLNLLIRGSCGSPEPNQG